VTLAVFPDWEGRFSRNGKKKGMERHRFSHFGRRKIVLAGGFGGGGGLSQNGNKKRGEKKENGRLRRPEAANGKPFPEWEKKRKKGGGRLRRPGDANRRVGSLEFRVGGVGVL
jgi:hypothetical protein